jgi:hypothetical protein
MQRFFDGGFFEKFPASSRVVFQIVRLVLKADRQIKKPDAEIVKSDLDKGF